jgi:aminoglycoside phosphotransferase (APT) family kinase protein
VLDTLLLPVPAGRTARRIEWYFLPPGVRRSVEARLGAPVVDAASRDGGYTPGLASVLTTAAGTRHFVKAASRVAQRSFAAAYAEEAARLATLPGSVPAPRLLWSDEVEDWVLLEVEHVAPSPWMPVHLGAALDALEQVAAAPTAALGLASFDQEHADLPALWPTLEALAMPLPGLARHAADAGRLASSALGWARGDALVHGDVHDDNLLVRPDGSVLLCDWKFPTRGAPWVDTVALLAGARGDGVDADAVLAVRPLTRSVPAEHVDGVLALLAGWFLHQSLLRRPPTSPYVRDFQGRHGRLLWDWLCARRGWS